MDGGSCLQEVILTGISYLPSGTRRRNGCLHSSFLCRSTHVKTAQCNYHPSHCTPCPWVNDFVSSPNIGSGGHFWEIRFACFCRPPPHPMQPCWGSRRPSFHRYWRALCKVRTTRDAFVCSSMHDDAWYWSGCISAVSTSANVSCWQWQTIFGICHRTKVDTGDRCKDALPWRKQELTLWWCRLCSSSTHTDRNDHSVLIPLKCNQNHLLTW